MPKPKSKLKRKLDPSRLTPTIRRTIRQHGIQAVVTLSKYGPTSYGFGHYHQEPPTALDANCRLTFDRSDWEAFAWHFYKAGIPLGTRIKFVATVVPEEKS